jgi:hypothetical protein
VNFVSKTSKHQEIREIWAIERGTLRACLRVIDETAGLDRARWLAVQEALAATRRTMRLAALARQNC